MNAAEALLLCRYAKAAAPAQYMDEYTPDAWFDLLEDLNYTDARESIKKHLQDHPYVAPSDIRAGVKTLRAKRNATHPRVLVPAELRKSWRDQAEVQFRENDRFGPEFYEERLSQKWHNEIFERIANGEVITEYAHSDRALAAIPEGW